MDKKLVFDGNTTKEQYEELYKLDMGEVFKVKADFETVMRRIEDYKPSNVVFEVFPITPGTDLYTIYGPDHCVVTDNRMLL